MKLFFTICLSCFFMQVYSSDFSKKRHKINIDSTKNEKTFKLYVGFKLGFPYFLKSKETILNSYDFTREELHYQGYTGNTKGICTEVYLKKFKTGIEFNFSYNHNQYFMYIYPKSNSGKIIRNPDIIQDHIFDRSMYLNKSIWSYKENLMTAVSVGYYSLWDSWSGESLRAISTFSIGKKKRMKLNLVVEKRWPKEVTQNLINRTLTVHFQYPFYAFVSINYKLI